MNGRGLKYTFLNIVAYPARLLVGWYMRVSPNIITCREFNDCVYDYEEGALDEAQLTSFKRHMKVCPICRNFLKTYEATCKAGQHVTPYENIDVPDKMPPGLIEAILEEKRKL